MLDLRNCPVCPSPERARTLETRELVIPGFKTLRRRKQCVTCGHRFATAEVPMAVAREVFAEDDE